MRGAFIREGLIAGLDDFEPFMPIDAAAHLVLATGLTLWFWLFALSSAWSVLSDRATRLWVLAFSLGFMLICINPFVSELWGANVTAKYLTWRLFWTLPLPAFLAILLVEGIAGSFHNGLARRGVLLVIISAVGLTLALGRPWKDGAFIGFRLGLKVPVAEYAVAQRVNQLAGKDAPVLAPEWISAWVPTFRQHAYPLVARRHYTEGILSVFADRVNAQELQERLALHDYVTSGGAGSETALSILRRWLGEKRISAITIALNHQDLEKISGVLHQAGFDHTDYLGYRLYYQPQAEALTRTYAWAIDPRTTTQP